MKRMRTTVVTYKEPKLGGNVLIKNDNLTRESWKLGKITHLNVSSNNLIRLVNLKLRSGKFSGTPTDLLYPVKIDC